MRHAVGHIDRLTEVVTETEAVGDTLTFKETVGRTWRGLTRAASVGSTKLSDGAVPN